MRINRVIMIASLAILFFLSVSFLIVKPSDSNLIVQNNNVKTLIVANHLSPDPVQASADYVCDGVNDSVEIQQAVDALPTQGGKITIYAGTYSLTHAISRAIDNVCIEGVGRGTYLTFDGLTMVLSAGAQRGWSFNDLWVDAGGVGVSSAVEWSMNNIWIGNSYIARRADTSPVNDKDFATRKFVLDNVGVGGGTGPQGQGYTWRGTWTAGVNYSPYDTVFHEGSSYDCILAVNSSAHPDVDSSHWTLVASKGDQGIQGIQGIQGATGSQGDKGDKGDTGLTGATGNTGATGSTGAAGTNGTNGSNGVSISWLGTFASAPGSPTLNQAYRNSSDNVSYVWNGSSWGEMVQDGQKGATGAQGIQGLTGSGTNGSNGQGYTWKGVWITGTSYVPYDTVSDNGSSYDCILAVSGSTHPVSDGSHWSIVASKGDTGTTGATGATGSTGVTGATGPNAVSGSTTTAFTGFLYGNGSTITTATNTDAQVAATVSASHSSGLDTALGTLGTKNPPVDADKLIYRNSESSDVLVTATWTQIKAFLKTYFDGIYATVGSSHTHSNQAILDGTQQSFTTDLKTSYDWLVTNITSSWKTTVDSFVSSKGQVSGLAPLDANSKVPTANLGGSDADNTKYLRGDQTWVTPSGGSVDPIATIDLYDEFLTGTLATGDIGDLGWSFTTTAPTVTASVANHPGIRRVNTSTTTNAANAFWTGGAATNDLIQFDEQWDFTFIVSVPTITTVSVFTGAMDGMVTAVGNQDRYGFEFNPATSAYWRMVTGNGSASTTTDTDVTVVAGTWYKLRVVRTGTGVTYYINGVLKGSTTTTLPDTPLSYGFHVQTLAASARSLDCDFFRMTLTGVTR